MKVLDDLGLYLFACFCIHVLISTESCGVSHKSRDLYLQSLPWVACDYGFCEPGDDLMQQSYGAELHPDDEHTK